MNVNTLLKISCSAKIKMKDYLHSRGYYVFTIYIYIYIYILQYIYITFKEYHRMAKEKE